MTPERQQELNRIRADIVRMAHYSYASHVGAALSVVDILYVLYTEICDITAENADEEDRDRVILSKGHASTALYAVLAHKGIIPRDALDRYYINGGVLPGHLDCEAVRGVDCSAGSLGHGAPVGLGMAMGRPGRKVYVVMGDGECNEGSVWEAVMLAGKLSLPNLTFIIDNNNLQGFGKADEIVHSENLVQALSAWGLDTYEVDGNDPDALADVLHRPGKGTKAIVAHTIKGKGVSYMENRLEWHYKSPNDEQLKQALSELGQ